jgi:hypothetical protein
MSAVGGSSSTGGTETMTGGSMSTGGSTSAAGGMETGGSTAVGGSETGGDTSTGGTAATATGGSSTTGGTTGTIVVVDDITALKSQGTACYECAISDEHCGPYVGSLGCGFFTDSYTAVSAFAGDSRIAAISAGDSVTQTLACGATLSCILSSGILANGSCYAPIADSATACFCGTTDDSVCGGGGANGVCKSLYEISLNTNDPGEIASIFTDYNYPGGDANYIAQCLNQYCKAECFHP